MQQENPRASLKVIYSCFDCPYFHNRSEHVDIVKEKYRCMVEKKDFSFEKMSPDGVPEFCPLPLYKNIKEVKEFAGFQEVFRKLEKNN